MSPYCSILSWTTAGARSVSFLLVFVAISFFVEPAAATTCGFDQVVPVDGTTHTDGSTAPTGLHHVRGPRATRGTISAGPAGSELDLFSLAECSRPCMTS